jgi:REP element-mobilizing transposase RayT
MGMSRFKGKYRIESARLSSWDYASAAWYFVTVCTHGSQCLFGNVADGEMHLSRLGEVAREYWMEIPQHFSNVGLDPFVVMPNHVHGIIILEPADSPTPVGDTPRPRREVARETCRDVARETRDVARETCRDVARETCRDVACNVSSGSLQRMSRLSPKAGSLSVIVRSYKAAVTRQCRLEGFHSFRWQARFYDHIIRSEESLRRIREYMANNAMQWELDKYYRPG